MEESDKGGEGGDGGDENDLDGGEIDVVGVGIDESGGGRWKWK